MEALAMEFDLLFSAVEDDTPSGVCGGDIDGEDIAAGVLARFQNSAREDHQHLCATVATMAQAVKDQGLPLTPVAYFGATASSLDRLSRDPASGSDPALASLLSFLALALPRVPRSVVRSRWKEVSDTLVRILGFDSLPLGCVRSGLRCASYFLVVGDMTDWSALSPLYGVLLCFVTDERPKVRKECHSCLSDVLRSFQNLPVLMPASEDITAIFERFLLLAGGSSADSSPSECSRGAMQVLYIFNAMKDCLPLMAVKHMNTILKYFKRLLDLRQLIVTRCIMEVLHTLCRSSTVEVAPELLQNLFCSLALSVSDNEKSPDQMASTARLLYVGTRKIYDLNKQIYILASEHEEAMFAAIEALKGLIRACVDESLIEQGVDQIITTDGELRKSGPTVIEKICATIEGFLGYRYNAVWDMSFVISIFTARYRRYISVRQVAGTRTARYRAVQPKIDRRRSISVVGGRLKGEIGRRRSIEGAKGRKKKKRKKKKKKERGEKEYTLPAHGPCPCVVVACRSWAFFLPRGEKDRGD
ncbi:hypothetical protein B296_00053538, partial [Ensete ventricosum]